MPRAKIESPSRPQPHHFKADFASDLPLILPSFIFGRSLQRSMDMRDKDALQAVLEDARCEAHFEDMVI